MSKFRELCVYNKNTGIFDENVVLWVRHKKSQELPMRLSQVASPASSWSSKAGGSGEKGPITSAMLIPAAAAAAWTSAVFRVLMRTRLPERRMRRSGCFHVTLDRDL